MEIFAYILWALGALFCGVNFYTSFVRYPVHLLLGRSKEVFQWVSGVPLLGTLFMIPAMILLKESPLFFWSGMVLFLIDTGGPHWVAGSMLWQKFGSRS